MQGDQMKSDSTSTGTKLLVIFGLVLLVLPPHVTGLAFLFFLFLYEYTKQAERNSARRGFDAESGDGPDSEDEISIGPGTNPGDGYPDFAKMLDDPGFIREQEDLR